MSFLKKYIFAGIIIIVLAAIYGENSKERQDFLAKFGLAKEKVSVSKIVKSTEGIVQSKNNTIYKWQDEKGKWQFTNIPPADKKNAAVIHKGKEPGLISHVEIESEKVSFTQGIGNRIKDFFNIAPQKASTTENMDNGE